VLGDDKVLNDVSAGFFDLVLKVDAVVHQGHNPLAAERFHHRPARLLKAEVASLASFSPYGLNLFGGQFCGCGRHGVVSQVFGQTLRPTL
jgi:hypothetical protein